MYKLSKYNYFVENEQRVIYFNGMTNILFDISLKEHENILRLFEDLLLFQVKYESIFNCFKEWGFIINEETSEIDIIRFRYSKAVFSDKFYQLEIKPTEDCNFNCWYCTHHSLIDDSKGGMQKDTIGKIKRHLDNMIKFEQITGLGLNWIGGEPLLYFDEVMYPIAASGLELTSKNHLPFRHHVTTNAYLIDENMVKKMEEIKLNSFQITLDGDKKRHNNIRNFNGKESYTKIMDSMNLILENIPSAQITLRLNFDNVTLKTCNMSAVFESISPQYRHRIFPDFVRVWQTIKPQKMTENSNLNNLHDLVASLGYPKPNPTNAFHRGHAIRCSSDRLYKCAINYDGKVYKCSARTNRELGVLHDNGKIEWNQEELSKLYAPAPFENQKCLVCEYLPICLGPCSQNKKTMILPRDCALECTDTSPKDFIIRLHKNQQT